MRIAIVDDLAAERALLKDRLEQQLHRRNVQADILEYESGETFLEAARKAPFTAAFLDIYMDGMTGMEAARTLRKTDTDCLLVFTTTSTDHALEGFQVRALHYLVKPFTDADIDALTDELLARVPQPDKYMELKVEGSEIHLRYGDIFGRIKYIIGLLRCIALEVDRTQVWTVAKSTVAQECNAGRDRHSLQRRAAVKGVVLNFCHTIRNHHSGYARAAFKRSGRTRDVSNRGNSFSADL